MIQLSIIQNKIYEIRGERVMLDFDLAEMYEVETRTLKQAVRRNIERFPKDLCFNFQKMNGLSLSQFVITFQNQLSIRLPLHSHLLNKALRCFQVFLIAKEPFRLI